MKDVPWANLTSLTVSSNTATSISVTWNALNSSMQTVEHGNDNSFNYVLESACTSCSTWDKLYESTANSFTTSAFPN